MLRIRNFCTILIVLSLLIPSTFLLLPTKTARAESFKNLAGPFMGGAASCAANYLVSALGNLLNNLKSVPTNDDATSAMNLKNCIDTIASAAAQVILKKLTQETVAWVNNGFKGAPFYIQDGKSFFKSVGDGEFTTYLSTLVQSQNPFTRDVARGLIQGYTGNSSQGFNLDQVIGPNWENFSNDFSEGGWEGFLAMTQNDDNNIFGAHIKANKAAGTTVTKSKEQLQSELVQNRGFLSFKKCVDPQNYQELPSQYNRVELELQANNDPNDTDTILARQVLAQYPDCKRYETQTPGGLIADKLTRTVNVTEDKLINAKDLNESLTAIFNKLMTQLFNKGIASLSGNQTFTPEAGTGGVGSNISVTQIQNTQTGGGVSGTNWYETESAFDITTDLPEVVQTQQAYITALNAHSAALRRLINALNELDYCIPGPRQNWEQDARQGLQTFLSSLNYNDDDEVAQTVFLATLGFPLTGAGNIGTLSGIGIGRTFADGQMNNIFNQYVDRINARYFNPNTMNNYVPSITPTARAEIAKIASYSAKIEQNNSLVAQANSNISTLNSYLIPRINALVTGHNNGTINDADYDRTLTSYKNLFASLPVVTEDIVNGVEANTGVAESQVEYIGSTDPTSLLSACQDITSSQTNADGTLMANDRRPYPGTTIGNGSGLTWSYAPGPVPNTYNSDSANGVYCWFDSGNACINSGSASASAGDSTFAPFETRFGIY
jgi:hypothetical protein